MQVEPMETDTYRRKSPSNTWKYVSLFLFLVVCGLGGYLVFDLTRGMREHTPNGKETTSSPVYKTTQSVKTSPQPTTSSTNKRVPICDTETCRVAAAKLMLSMNTSVDPCENFYDYACGNWGTHHEVPRGREATGVFSLIRDSVQRRILGLLEEPISKEKDIETVIKVKETFKSCLDIKSINARADKPLLEDLDSYGGWPVLSEKWDENKFDIFKTISRLTNSEIDTFMKINVYKDRWTRKNNLFTFVGMRSTMSKYYMKHAKFRKALEVLFEEVAVLMGAKPVQAKIDAASFIKFESELINISKLVRYKHKSYSELYHEVKYSNLSVINSAVKWQDLIKRTVDESGNAGLINDDTTIAFYTYQGYFDNLMDVFSFESKRTIANYMMFRLVYKSIDHVSANVFQGAINKFKKALGLKIRYNDRLNLCKSGTSRVFNLAIGRMFVERYFDNSAKETASEMVDELKNAFKGMLDRADWMDEEAKRVGKEKADAINENIGYPDYIMNDDRLNSIYKLVNTSGDFYSTWLSVKRWSQMYLFKSLSNKEESSWFISPQTVNAFYSPTENSITFPAGILQTPFYHKNYPKYLNYAGIGFVIGHEITHGFDDSGRRYDKDGHHKVWWNKEVTKKYIAKTKCYINQYNRFTVKSVNKHVNGSHTLNENLADNGAVLESFLAYRNYVKTERKGVEEPILRGFEDMTQNQLFFLNIAQAWCSNIKEKSYWKYILQNEHSPGRYRILGSMSNSDDFSRVYKCKKGSYMNPIKKCKLW